LNCTVDSVDVGSDTAPHRTKFGKDHRVDVRNPATGEVIAAVEGLTAEETDAAIGRAADAFGPWRAVAPGDRARLLDALRRREAVGHRP
jgi:acyl-CoA reductase-like NAD-dependent aldehyde dehydrogenase